jgi:hypothetical protein
MALAARLIELNPSWVAAGGPGIKDTDGHPVPVGLTFDCPCGCEARCYLPLANPLDGGPPHDPDRSHPHWDRTGDAFDSLTIRPSIQRTSGCRTHFHITNGLITP